MVVVCTVDDFLLIICIIHAAGAGIAAVADIAYFLLIFNFNKEQQKTEPYHYVAYNTDPKENEIFLTY